MRPPLQHNGAPRLWTLLPRRRRGDFIDQRRTVDQVSINEYLFPLSARGDDVRHKDF